MTTYFLRFSVFRTFWYFWQCLPFYINGFRFFFYLNEHEPIHVHVSKGDSEARIVLVPELDIS
ncbi:MAG: DUF4160 domain-containing protein [Dyadobacter sp.]|uniref:DUF4160 domain-containing protein n=1 Tax=Dyadobacter sp. TaxID=1914288 RepID=UPI0032648733